MPLAELVHGRLVQGHAIISQPIALRRLRGDKRGLHTPPPRARAPARSPPTKGDVVKMEDSRRRGEKKEKIVTPRRRAQKAFAEMKQAAFCCE